MIGNAGVVSSVVSTTTKVKSSTTFRLPRGYNAVPPFALYVRDNFEQKASEQMTDMIKRLSPYWMRLDPSEKNAYFEESKLITEHRKVLFQNYPEERKLDLLINNIQLQANRNRSATKIAIHNFRAVTKMPKRPLTSFFLFLNELRSKDELPKPVGKEGVAKFSAFAGGKWRSLAMQDKMVYKEKAEALRDAYNKELAVWKQKNATAIKKFAADLQQLKLKVRSSKIKIASASGTVHAEPKPEKPLATAPKKEGKSAATITPTPPENA